MNVFLEKQNSESLLPVPLFAYFITVPWTSYFDTAEWPAPGHTDRHIA